MKAKDYRQVLQELGNIMEEAVHIVDATGKTILYNEKMAGLEMTNREDILGKPFREVFSSIPPQESTLYRALKENQATINKQQTYRNRYGKEITTVNSTIPVEEDGQVIAAIEVSRDITEIKSLSNTILDLQKETLPVQNPKNHR